MALGYGNKFFGTGSGGGSSLPSLTGNTGKVLTVNAGETGTEWAAAPASGAGGADTQILFNDGGVQAGSTGFTFQKASKAVSGTGPLTLTPATDIVPFTARAYSSGTSAIAQFQTSANAPLSNIGHDGKFNGDVVGNVTGNVSGTAGDGLTSASGTAPLTLTLAAKGLTGSVAAMTAASAGAGGAAGLVPASSAGDQAKFLRADATWQTSAGGGITNGAGANVIPKSDGTNLVASALNEASPGAIATAAGTALGLTATAPAATTGASQAGTAVTITASPAVASTDTNGAAAGGSVTITAGAAAQRVSGNANGGDINLTPGAGIGTGTAGIVNQTTGLGMIVPALALTTTNPFAWNQITGTTSSTLIRNYNQICLAINGQYSGIAGGSWFSIGLSSASDADGSTLDTFFRRKGAANPAWGVASATPVAYVHSLAADSRGGTDTDVKGAKATLIPGLGTGAASGGDFSLQTGTPGTTGTAANTPSTRWYGVAAPKALTSGAGATGIFEIAMPTDDTYVGYEISYTVGMTDGTNAAIHTGKAFGAAYRATGGTITATNPSEGSEANHHTSGSSTADTWTVTAGTGKITINLASTKGNAVGTVTKSEISYSVRVNGRGSTVTPL